MVLTLHESLIYSTVKLVKVIQGVPVETGTGFFWHTQMKNGRVGLSIVTNKHVVRHAESIKVCVHLADNSKNLEPSGRFHNYNIFIDHDANINHPDENVDLCAFGVAEIFTDLASKGLALFYKSLCIDNVPEDDYWSNFDAIEDVLMTGCPNGILDEYNNRPIVRRGITATQMGLHYNGKPEFLVDMACFPGSSGSPVFVNQLGYLDKNKNQYVMGAPRFFLVGVLYAGPVISNQGVISFSSVPSFQMATMMHLGNVVQASQLRILDAEIVRRIHSLPDI